ncbi:MAG: acetate kinase [Eubacteriales bacterium]|jgi:acetate kinase|nr:acetate kinase [Eubacteriales bacterium]MDD4716800.1 acetate kinase [Eubacteriales bacterium]
MKVLVINAGSSSLKYQLLKTKSGEVLAKGNADRIGLDNSFIKHSRNGEEIKVIPVVLADHTDAIKAVIKVLTDKGTGVIKSLKEIEAVGHRVVHGGEKFSTSVLITPEIKVAIKACIPLAPLHNPPNITGIEACEAAMPNIPQVAVFDTAFHQTMPPKAFMYALPYEVYEEHKVRRYGFHGTSHAYVAKRAAELLGKPFVSLKLVTCHLGNGSSIAAVKHGECIDTSMGLTPLAGVCMGTRCGDIDPAIVTFLMQKEGLDAKGIDNLMNKKSGVAGISGVSSDFRDLEDASEKGNERAELALQMFEYQCKKFIGAYAAAMGGLDAVVFTAGIGENVHRVRANIIAGLEFLGMKLDTEKNKARGVEAVISTDDSNTTILMIPTNEELAIAMATEAICSKK